MAFRDDNEALRQRVQTLEEELADTRAELEELRNPPKVRVEIEQSAPKASGLAAKVAAKEQASRHRKRQQELELEERRRKVRERLEQHGSRLEVTRAGSETILEVGPAPLREQLIDQMGFGFFFAAINPGIFIVAGLTAMLATMTELSIGSAIGVAVPVWLTLLVALNLLYAHFARPRFRIVFDEENFEVKKSGNESTSFLGRRRDLEVRVDDEGPGEVRLRHSSGRVDIEALIQKDLDAIRELMVSAEPDESEMSLREIMRAKARG